MNITAIVATVIICFVLEQLLLGVVRILGIYTTVREREARVYVLFGEIVAVLDTPGLHFLWPIMGWKALIINLLGNVYTRSMSLDQQYIRSIPVNSEEGTPMG